MGKLLITGATGLVGQQLIAAFSDKKLHILTTQKSLMHNGTDRIKYFYWSPKQAEIDVQAFQGVSTIINLAGANIGEKRWSQTRKLEILNSRVQGLQLIHAVLSNQTHQVEHLISASAVGIYEPDCNKIYSETDIPFENERITFLSDVCYQWEAAAQQFSNLQIKVSILRTGMVLSNKGGAFLPIKKSMFMPIVPMFSHGKQLVSWISLDDLVRMYQFVAKHQLVGVFNAVATQVLTHKAMMNHFAQFKFGRQFLLFPIPTWVLRIILGDMAQGLLLDSVGVSNEQIRQHNFEFLHPSLDTPFLAQLFAKK